MYEIIVYGNPILRKKAEPVTEFDEDLKTLVSDMLETMRENDGVGLAATQIAKPIRLAVIDATDGENPPLVLINPEITWFSEEHEDSEEGCLSIPDIRLKVNRPVQVTVKAQDENGRSFEISNASGLLARALQHEIDHLNGILFVDKVSAGQRQLVNGKLKKMAKSQKQKGRAAG